jgi:hypothetical protein
MVLQINILLATKPISTNSFGAQWIFLCSMLFSMIIMAIYSAGIVVQLAKDHAPVQEFMDLVYQGYEILGQSNLPYFKYFIAV